MPSTYEYSVELSEDMLNLFSIEAQYATSSSVMTPVLVRDPNWKAVVSKTDEFEPHMLVMLTAREEAKNGSLLKKDVYEMSIECDIKDRETASLSMLSATKALDSDHESFQFKVPIPDGVKADDISIEMPYLKYDKHFAFCFTVDDSYVNGWSKIFSSFNGRWMDNVEFFHIGAKKSAGHWETTPFCSTDGCGNDRHFTFGEAIWPTLWNDYNPGGFILDESTSMYISWKELGVMTDLGNAVHWHDVDKNTWDITVVGDIVSGLQRDYDKTMTKIGYPMKTLGQPNGDANYLAAGQESPLVCLTRATTKTEPIYLKEGKSLYKKNIFGGGTNSTIEKKLEELAVEAESDNPILQGLLAHRCGDEYVDMFRNIYSLYGKGGKDNIWVTSYDELYEYYERRNSVSYNSWVEDGYKVFEVSFPKKENFLYDELSFVVRGAKNAAEPVSSNLVGFSSAARADGSVLVNCNFSKTLTGRIEKYIKLYHNAGTTEYKEEYKLDAQDLISLLREDMREEYLKKLEKEEDPEEPVERDLPIIGIYTKQQVQHYLKQYDKHTIFVTMAN